MSQSENMPKVDSMFDQIGALSPSQNMRRRARSHIGLITGVSITLIVTIIAIFAPLLAPFDPYEQDLTKRLLDPVW